MRKKLMIQSVNNFLKKLTFWGYSYLSGFHSQLYNNNIQNFEKTVNLISRKSPDRQTEHGQK